MGILIEQGYLKYSLIGRLEFGEMHVGTDVNYFSLMEDRLLAGDNVVYESVSNNRRSN